MKFSEFVQHLAATQPNPQVHLADDPDLTGGTHPELHRRRKVRPPHRHNSGQRPNFAIARRAADPGQRSRPGLDCR